MPIINVGSFDNAMEASDSEQIILDPGVYSLRIMEVSLGESQAGRPMLKVTLTVCDNPNAKFNDKKLFYNCPLPQGDNTKGISFLVRLMKALGQEWEGEEINTDAMLGCTVNANVNIVERNGNKYPNIKNFV